MLIDNKNTGIDIKFQDKGLTIDDKGVILGDDTRLTDPYTQVNLRKISTYIEEENFIQHNDLTDISITKNLGYIVEPDSKKYYTSLATAITDINNSTSEHSSESGTDAVCRVCTDGKITVVEFLSDISSTSNITISVPLFIDLNGYTLSISGMFTSSKFLCIYGNKAGSTIDQKIYGFAFCSDTMYCIGYTLIWPLDIFVYHIIVKKGSKKLCFVGLNFTFEDNVEHQCNIIGPEDTTSSCDLVILDQCNIDMSIKAHAFTDGVINGTFGTVKILNSNISVIDKKDKDVNTACGISYINGGCLVVMNSLITGSNNAIQVRMNRVFIEKCILNGCRHGGLYTRGGQTAYVKDTVCNWFNDPNQSSPNHYASYFSDGISYCDNVKFTSDNQLYNETVIKVNETSSGNTVYFSNCVMDRIRVDTNCTGCLGQGMSYLKDSEVDGTLSYEEDKTYRYNVIYKEV